MKEKDVIDNFISKLNKAEIKNILVNVKWSFCDIEHISVFFIPDIDLMIIKNNDEIICYEAKKSGEMQDLYEAIGEALFDLVTPVIITTNNKGRVRGGICDKVYILLPDNPAEKVYAGYGPFLKDDYESFIKKIFDKLPIGLIIGDKEVIPAKQNPFLNRDAKDLILKNIHCLKQYLKYI